MGNAMMRLVPIVAAMAALSSCNRDAGTPTLKISDVVVTAPGVPGGPAAAYFTITTDKERTRLVSITSPSAESVEFHATRQEGQITKMVPLEPGELTFGPANPMRFSPGERHAMVMGLDPAIRPGGTVSLTFQTDRAPPYTDRAPAITVEAEVRGPGQAHAQH
jgi:copper(I)-binding protein